MADALQMQADRRTLFRLSVLAAGGAFIGLGSAIQSSPASAEVLWGYPLKPDGDVTGHYSDFNQGFYGEYGWHHALDVSRGGAASVHAVADGVVEKVVTDAYEDWYGYFVRIRHADAYWSSYAHLEQAPLVALGQTVHVGQRVGVMGSTGNPSTGRHLHLEIYHGGTGRKPAGSDARIDPEPLVLNAPRPGSAVVSLAGNAEEIDMYIRRQSTGEIAAFGSSWRQQTGGNAGRHVFSSLVEYQRWAQILSAYNAQVDATGGMAAGKVYAPPMDAGSVMGVSESDWTIICGMYGV